MSDISNKIGATEISNLADECDKPQYSIVCGYIAQPIRLLSKTVTTPITFVYRGICVLTNHICKRHGPADVMYTDDCDTYKKHFE